MWRDFFFFHRGDKIAICFLAVVIVMMLVWSFIRLHEEGGDALGFAGNDVADSTLMVFKTSVEKSRKRNSLDSTSYEASWGRHKNNRPYWRRQSGDSVRKYVVQDKYPEGTVIDLNAADTTELKKIPGIGSAYARRIVRIREQLGGFHAVEQLQKHTYLLEEINRWFVIKTPHRQSVEINKAGLDELKKHPYLDYRQARFIMDYRRKFGNIKDLNQLLVSKYFTEEHIRELEPYVKY